MYIHILMSQIFKKEIPSDLLITLVSDIAEYDNGSYIINNIAFKKGIFNGKILAFTDACKPYYHKSKLKYLERTLTYSSFITIIRQICNCNNIKYRSNIKYDKSKYDIVYYIYTNS